MKAGKLYILAPMRKLLSLILSLLIFSTVYAQDSRWKIYPVFDEEVTHVIETPDFVYFTSRQLLKNSDNETLFSLFRYDKKGEELLPLSQSNLLNGNTIRDVVYNPGKGYLAVLYKNYDIDLLYNNGQVSYIPYYAQASLTYPKDVNGLAIDPSHDRLYLATEFGYVAINDKKNEVAESRLYGSPLGSYCRVGDTYFASQGKELLMAPANSPRLSLDQYESVANFDYPVLLYPVSDSVCLLSIGTSNYRIVKLLTITSAKPEIKDFFQGNVFNIDYNSKGLVVTSDKKIYQVSPDGSYTSIDRHPGYSNTAAVSENMVDVWNGLKRKGLCSIKKSGEEWSVTRDWMLPNSPATFASTSFANHPSKGFLLLSYGSSLPTYKLHSFAPFQLSGLKNGRWTNFAPSYTNPERTNLLTATNGFAIDPDNSNYVYITSFHNGIARINLNDPKDIIHLSHSKDADAGNDGFVVLTPTPASVPGYSNISAPYFDKQGNLWMSFADWDDTGDPNPHFYCWTAADRKATTSASDIRMPQHVEFDVYCPVTNYLQSLVLSKTGNGIIVHAAGNSDERLILIDTNGTAIDTSDDKIHAFPDFTDSDGSEIEMGRVNYLWEDPSTGYVWVCHANGVFYFLPSQVRANNFLVNRIKVPRNDGTNLADYLLEGVSVNHVTADSAGRKWFSTAGGGVICTSSDGREILEEFTTDNSMLPDDVVYAIGYNSDNNSLLISTNDGQAEYSLPASTSSSSKEDIKAYPNPVRPQYSGYVTITDIPQGSFVKITDAAGNLVKELGVMSGFEILWDLSDTNYNRVKSGVYHILVSPSDENSSYSAVGKIMVIS